MVAANTYIPDTDELELIEVGYGVLHYAGRQAQLVVPSCLPTVIDVDLDGKLDVRVVTQIEHEDANGNQVVDPGECIVQRIATIETLHRAASPYLTRVHMQAVYSRQARWLDGRL